MDYDKLMQKYRNKYYKLGGEKGIDSDRIIEKLIRKWWNSVLKKDYQTLEDMMSSGIQIVNNNGILYSKDKIIKKLEKFTLQPGYKLYDFHFTNDGENIIASYLVDNEIESTTSSKKLMKVNHSVVFNKHNKIISWNNFSDVVFK